MPGVTITLTDEQLAELQVNDGGSSYTPGDKIDSPAAAAKVLKYMGRLKKEHFVLLTLDGDNRIINKHSISVGTLTSSLVHPREVFRPAVQDLAASIIVAHNHPSGNLTASGADKDVTDRLQEAGQIMGVKLIDHLIITRNDYASILD